MNVPTDYTDDTIRAGEAGHWPPNHYEDTN